MHSAALHARARVHVRGVLVATVGVLACAAAVSVVLLTGASSRLPAPDALLDPAVLTFSAAHWDSTRLPQDSRNPNDQIRMMDAEPLTQTVLASHLGGVHLPMDRVSARRAERHVGEKINNAVRALDFVAGTAKGAPQHWLQPAQGNTALSTVSRSMAGEIADNSAAALRQQSFRWALDDCKKESSCESLLGKKLYNVLQTKSGRPNLHIYHDEDDDRKDEEREMEHDYRQARDTEGESESQSESRWQKLQGLMHKSFKASAPTAASVLRQVDQIKAERIPDAEKRILISTLMRKSSVARRAASLNDSYRSETSLIFPSNSKAHWNTYKATMMPSGDDDREELGGELRQHARPSEADTMRKYQSKAANEMSGKSASGSGEPVNGLDSSRQKRLISSAAQRQVAEWTKAAAKIRHRLADGSVSALRSKRVAGEKQRDDMVVQTTQDAIHDELSRYGSVFSSRADEDKLQNEEHVAREALRESRRRERRLQRARARNHDKLVAKEVAEAKKADAELASYDSAFIPHAAKAAPSLSALGLISGKADSRKNDNRGRRGRPAARDFRTPGTHGVPRDSAAREERRDERTAEDIAPMVQLAENTLKTIGQMHGHGEHGGRGRGGARQAGGKCYLSGGKEVECSELAELGNLMKKVYGSKARDVEIVSRDSSFDPTKVFADSSAAQKAEATWMHIENSHDDDRGKGLRKTGSGHRRGREEEEGAEHEHASRGHAHEHRSAVGELLHEANVQAAKEQTKPAPVKQGSLAALSDNLGGIIGW